MGTKFSVKTKWQTVLFTEQRAVRISRAVMRSHEHTHTALNTALNGQEEKGALFSSHVICVIIITAGKEATECLGQPKLRNSKC